MSPSQADSSHSSSWSIFNLARRSSWLIVYGCHQFDAQVGRLSWPFMSPRLVSNSSFIHRDLGLRTPNEVFFSLKSQTFGLGQINFGVFGVYSADLSAPILVLWVPCTCFPLINHYFYKKISFQNFHLGFGLFEFGPQRIRVLAIVRSPWSRLKPSSIFGTLYWRQTKMTSGSKEK